jgi:hypothetical protein
MAGVKVIRDERTGIAMSGKHKDGSSWVHLHPSKYLRGWIGKWYVLAPIPGTEDHRLLAEAVEVMR